MCWSRIVELLATLLKVHFPALGESGEEVSALKVGDLKNPTHALKNSIGISKDVNPFEWNLLFSIILTRHMLDVAEFRVIH